MRLREIIVFLLVSLPLLCKGQDRGFHCIVSPPNHIQVYWNAVEPAGTNHTLLRQFPHQTDWDTITNTVLDHYFDTINQRVCDSISYQLLTEGFVPAFCKALLSDPLPTTPPTPSYCEVDSATQKILLHWFPSPDPDIEGYAIYSRADENAPWLLLETLSSTDTFCFLPNENPLEPHLYRINAYDSCGNASPLTDYYGNMVLQTHSEPCDTKLTATWNAYPNTPDATYQVQIITASGAGQRETQYMTTQQLRADIAVSPSAREVAITVLYFPHNTSSPARSNTIVFRFQTADTCAYLDLLSASVIDDKTVAFTAQVDPDFQTSYYTLYRRLDGAPYTEVARLHPDATGNIYYEDRNASPSVSHSTYRLGVLDGCGRNEKYSNTLSPIFLTLEHPDVPSGEAQIYNLDWTEYMSPRIFQPEYVLQRHIGATTSWEDIISQSHTNYSDPIENPAQRIYYRVLAYQGNDTVCSNTVSCAVPTRIWIPNAFTPALNENSTFCLIAQGVSDYQLTIYTRQGLLAYQTDNPSTCWDGRFANGNEAPMGTYIYYLTYIDSSHSRQEKVGTILLIR